MKYFVGLILVLVLGCCVYSCNWLGTAPHDNAERMIVTFEWETLNAVTTLAANDIDVIDRLDLINGVSCYLTSTQRRWLIDNMSVQYIEPDYEVMLLEPSTVPPRSFWVHPLGTFVSTTEQIDWGMEMINAPDAWKSNAAQQVRIGIIDTGICTSHPDLTDAVIGGFNAIDGGSYEDDNNHGTYVATVLGARRNGVGIVGVAPECSLYAIKVMDARGRGRMSDIVEGYEWALGQGIQVVNLSLGSYHQSTAMRDAMELADVQGMGTVAAGGNDGVEGLIYPARNPVAVCVGAIAPNGQRAGWSNYGAALMTNGVLAPGEWVLAGNMYGGWQRVTGTSIAAPHVTGLVGLLLGMKWCERRFIFEGASRSTTPDIYWGHGTIDARKSLDIMIKESLIQLKNGAAEFTAENEV